jgi:DNA-binding FrmR family transcriptional regulator
MITKRRHQHTEQERRASIIRVRKIVGQLSAVQRMIDQGRDCAEILLQIVSARRGLKSLAEKLIHSHTIHCIEEARTPAEGRRKLRELLTVLERYVE